MLWSQRRNSGAHGAENSIQISTLARVEPWHLAAADVATRLPRTPPFSRLLRHAGGYSRTILTPNLQGCVNCVYIYICIYISPKTVLYLIAVGGEQPSRGMPGVAMPSWVKAIG